MPNLNKFYTWCIQTCNAPDVGYSLSYRAQQTVNGITYYDCSSFVYYAMREGGWTNLPGYPFTTYDMIPVLLAGGWHEVSATGTILAGDIGWNQEHTEVAYSRGDNGLAVFMGAHDDSYPLQCQVSIGHPVIQGGVWVDDPTFQRSFDRIFRYGSGGATEYGVMLPVVCALCGNAYIESHVNPAWVRPQTGDTGLWQWYGTRLTDFQTWCQNNNYQTDDPEAQMQYLVAEDYWNGTLYGISSLTDFLGSTSTNIDELTEAFWYCWIGTTPSYLQDRIDFAHEAYDYINLHANDTTITAWETTPMQYLTKEQSLKNCVMLYRFYSAGGGGGGTPSEADKRKMPLWMKIKYHI